MPAGRTIVKPQPRNDAYTVLLTLSLFAMIAACALLFYDLKRYPSSKPPAGSDRAPTAAPAGEQPPVGFPGAGAPGNPAPGGANPM